MDKQLVRFLIVGMFGFIVDLAVLSIAFYGLGLSPYWARIPSFSLAVASTWYLNYHWAFSYKRRQSKLLNFSYYLTVQGLGVTVNILIYSTLLYFFPYFLHYPEAALVIASAIVLLLNYAGLSRWVFTPKFSR